MLTLTAEIVHFIAALVVIAEALNKLERVCPLADGLTRQERLIDVLKAMAWVALALGAGGAIASPFLWFFEIPASDTRPFVHRPPSFAEVASMVGFAILIVRQRLKEVPQ